VPAHLPEQYWWGYKRFRRQPPGVEKFYAGI
jgi:KDO2-lipid IV(A) lauroyltransferase